jgi:hypothetical protein
MTTPFTPKEFTQEVLESSGYRVYLSNLGRDKKAHPVKKKHVHLVDWVGFFVPPNYDINQCKTWVPMHSWSIERLIQWSKVTGDVNRTDGLIYEAVDHFMGKVPDSTSLQDSYEGRLKEVMKPDDIVEEVRQLVNKWFPMSQFNGKLVPQAKYKNKFLEVPVEVCLPIRVVASLVCIAFACEEANRGDTWYINFYGCKAKPRIAGCLMALGVYLYRRYTHASIDQIATVLRIPKWE